MIEARDLSKSYAGTALVQGVGFTVRPGEVLGVLGPQGSGKTTLLRILGGLIAPSSGEAVVAGLSTTMDLFRIKNQVGYASREASVPPRSTSRELLRHRGELHGVPLRERLVRIESLIAAFDLGRLAELPLAELAPEHRQRVHLACALLHDPPVLLLDEPTQEGNLLGGHFLRMTLSAARHSGKAVVLATRSTSAAEGLCDRVLLLHQGQVRDQGTIAELCARAQAPTFTEAVRSRLPQRFA